MKAIVGYDGFVGSNIVRKVKFDQLYNKANIEEAYGSEPDLLIYAGVPAEVYYANKYPEKDLEIVNNAINNIKKIKPKKIVLISSVNVYPNNEQGDENKKVDLEDLEPYGKNRRILENWVKENLKDYLIVRLPGLFGKGIKKNFIYDLINITPSKLTESKIKELSIKNKNILKYYHNNEDGFYVINDITIEERKKLIEILNELNFTALNFTDSRGMYQYFNLEYLWDIINKALDNNLRILNISTEPFSINELYNYLYNKDFDNKLNKEVANYNMKTIHYELFDGFDGYIMNKEQVMKEIKKIVEEEHEIIGI